MQNRCKNINYIGTIPVMTQLSFNCGIKTNENINYRTTDV